jgi:hypothetical protein
MDGARWQLTIIDPDDRCACDTMPTSNDRPVSGARIVVFAINGKYCGRFKLSKPDNRALVDASLAFRDYMITRRTNAQKKLKLDLACGCINNVSMIAELTCPAITSGCRRR